MASREAAALGVAHTAEIDFEYGEERRARIVEESVRVEVDEIADDRSRATVARDGRVVRVTVEAADLIALRAGVNTWTRLLEVAERITRTGDRLVEE
ncbi:KEOPS complex subunit Pcc1 [Halobellus limi]|jgi:KEOPS complex subunit Pcc1|uniref:KEOPS complex Pcc1-like subunit n=1 Tax=Halobellus limi TaxID=699433 RepID=A0A1H5YLY1_9EURY|nr:KEOPS complex subunit Pcc1 [Halobellus limi]QCC48419.1 KEOPS complex Pcc1-like subunit [Halobellus limi]SEG24507.1 KEOPS complex subunit Pcc1 [Halobellus limi]